MMRCMVMSLVVGTVMSGVALAQTQPPPAPVPTPAPAPAPVPAPAPASSEDSSAPAGADQPASISTAQDIVDRFIEATGGREAWMALKSIRGLGTLEVIGTTLKADVAIYQRPTAYRRSVDHGQSGTQVTIRNGDQAWQVRPDGVVTQIQGPQLESLIRDRHLNPLLHANELYASMELLGVEQVDTAQAWKIRCVPIDTGSGEVIRYFDVATGFQLKIVEFGPADDPGIPTEIFPADYRDAGAVKVPFETTIALLRSRMRITMHAMQTDVGIPDCLFEPPAEVPESASGPKPPAP